MRSANFEDFLFGTYPNGDGDTDLGSAGVLLIPDNELTEWPQLSVGGDKEGGLWFIDRTNPMPNGFNNSCAKTCTCTPTGSNPSGNVQTFWTGTAYRGKEIQGGLAYWEYDHVTPTLNYLFAEQYGKQLFRYPLCNDPRASYPIDPACSSAPLGSTAGGQPVNFPTGGTPTVSADSVGATDALVWAIGGQVQDQNNNGNGPPTSPGVLYAFDATTMQQKYSSTNTCTSDAINPSTKFSVPTVANGYVYLGTESDNVNIVGQGTFYIFGPSSTACQ